MPIDLTPHLDPATTAVISLEVQENLLLPEKAIIPGLAAHAAEIGLIDRLAALYAAARRVGSRVVYVTDQRRHDGVGAPGNGTMGRSIARPEAGAPPRARGHGPIVSQLTPQPEDIDIEREQGMTGFYSTPLDGYLRNLGVKTVIITGVSANIAVNGTTVEAYNRGYRVIVPNDCIAGDPPEYVSHLLRYTFRNLALVGPAQSILDHWATLDVPAPSSR